MLTSMDIEIRHKVDLSMMIDCNVYVVQDESRLYQVTRLGHQVLTLKVY